MPRLRAETAVARHELAGAIGARLLAARFHAGLAQSAAGRAVGLSQNAIARLEIGARQLAFTEAVDLARLYGVAIERFDPRPTSGGGETS